MTRNAPRVGRRQLLTSLGVATATGLTGCQWRSGTDGREGGPRSPKTDDPNEGEGNSEPAGVDREIQLAVGTEGDHRLAPPVRAVERSEEVRIQFVNESTTSLAVSFEAYPVEADLTSGEQTTVTFAFHAPGIYPITTGQLRHSGQFFVYPRANSELPQVTERDLRLLVNRVAGQATLYPSTLFALEYDDIALDIANATAEATAVSVDAFNTSTQVQADGSAEFSFVAEEPGIYRITTDATVDGQLVVFPKETDFSRISVAGRRRLQLIADEEAEWLHSVPSTFVCKAGEELVLDVVDAQPVKATPETAGVHSLSSLTDTGELEGQVVALP